MKPTIIIVLFCTLLVAPLHGCAGIGETIEQAQHWRSQAHDARESAETELGELIAEREASGDGSSQAEMIDAAIARAQAKIAVLDAAIVHADMVLNEAQNPSDGLTRIAGQVVPFVPAPVQGPLLLGAALLATIARSQQLKAGTRSIIKSIQHAVNNDEAFGAAFRVNADTIRTIQTPLARRMVDKVQRG